MNIEINNKTHTTEINRQSNSAVKKTTTTTPETTVAQKTDSVNLSIETAVNSLKSVPSVNAERVEHFKSAIDNGTYQVDYEGLANNIIKSEQELPNTG